MPLGAISGSGRRVGVVVSAVLWLAGCGAATYGVGDGGEATRHCTLANGAQCPAGTSCPAGDGCNTCSCPASGGSAVCTQVTCASEASAPPGDATATACTDSAQCPSAQVCAFSPGCGPGTCQPRLLCDSAVPFCGCDGHTHVASCLALVPVASFGACATPDAGNCGGCSLAVGGNFCEGPTDGLCANDCCSGWNCDLVRTPILCTTTAPQCPSGEVPSVTSLGCWGPCVRAAHCAPIACGAAGQCPGGFTCRSGSCTPN